MTQTGSGERGGYRNDFEVKSGVESGGSERLE